MSKQEVKEQLQEDVLSILESFGIQEALNRQDWENLKNSVCDSVIHNLNKLDI